MSDKLHPQDSNQPEDPKWLHDIQELADQILGAQENGSACEQVHPIIAEWYEQTLQKEPPEARPSVWQAISCLATEVMLDAEDDDTLSGLFENVDEDALGMWIEDILMLGRAMEIALRKGELDDL